MAGSGNDAGTEPDHGTMPSGHNSNMSPAISILSMRLPVALPESAAPMSQARESMVEA